MRDNDGRQAVVAFLGGVAIMVVALGAFLLFVGGGDADHSATRPSGLTVRRTERPNCLNPNACREPTPEFAAAYNNPEACDGSGKRVCLVPLGYVPKDLVEHLVDYYAAEYGLELHVLPTVSLARMEWSRPGQMEAEALENLYTSAYFRSYNDGNVVLIGLTSLDIYTAERPEWKWFFGYTGDRHAVISAFRMDPVNWGLRVNDELRNKRVRTLMNKYIAMEYYGLPLNDNPRSVLYRLIGGLGTLDRIDERIPVPSQR